jgi:hypothetical protein
MHPGSFAGNDVVVNSGRRGDTIPATADWLHWSSRNPKEPATSISKDFALASPSHLPSGWAARVGPSPIRLEKP